MRKLTNLVNDKEASIYVLDKKKINVLVFSTPQTRKICNSPEIVGYDFINRFRSGMIAMLKKLPGEIPFQSMDDRSICLLHFLRGGLNFGLMEVMHKAFGFDRCSASFMTSQRYKKSGKWAIKSDQYRTFALPPNADIFLGDVIATGTTLRNGLGVLLDKLKEERKNIRSLTVFTIGCAHAETILEEYHEKFKANFNYHDTYLFYAEGIFGLAEPDRTLRLGLPGTDLLRHPAILTPEFELSQYEKLSAVLERCTIYDMGAKAFEPLDYLHEVKEYWSRLARQGISLYDACKERWPEVEYHDWETFKKAKEKVWKDISLEFLNTLYQKYLQRWTPHFTLEAQKKESLERFCKERIKEIDRKLS